MDSCFSVYLRFQRIKIISYLPTRFGCFVFVLYYPCACTAFFFLHLFRKPLNILIMAKILYSAIGITRMSGKQSGTIFAFNKYGNYMRNWAKSTYQQKQLLQTARVQFVSTALTWKTIGAAAQAAWNEFALSQSWRDRLGQMFTPSGYMCYMKFNTNLQTIGKEIKDLPQTNPAENGDFYIDKFSVDIGTITPGSTLSLSALSTPTMNAFAATASFYAVPKGYSQDFGTVKNKYKRFGSAVFNRTTADEIDLTTALTEYMSATELEVGQTVYVKVNLYDINGRDFPPMTARIEVIDSD